MTNWTDVKGRWNALRDEAHGQWERLTDDDWNEIAGDRKLLIARLQFRYGWTRHEAERRIEVFFDQNEMAMR